MNSGAEQHPWTVRLDCTNWPDKKATTALEALYYEVRAKGLRQIAPGSDRSSGWVEVVVEARSYEEACELVLGALKGCGADCTVMD